MIFKFTNNLDCRNDRRGPAILQRNADGNQAGDGGAAAGDGEHLSGKVPKAGRGDQRPGPNHHPAKITYRRA